MACFVLVHGAWHGGWCWRDVRAILRGRGHEVFTPTLTGLGERSHLMSPDIDMNTHIQDIVNVIAWEELDEVILVGHSYGGNVITGVADRIKHRLRHVVYLDAFLPADGQSSASGMMRILNPDVADQDIEANIASRLAAADENGGSHTHNTNLFDIPDDRPEQYDWVKRRITTHPVKTLVSPMRLENAGSDGLPRTYILCTDRPDRTAFMVLAERLKHAPGWTSRELPTGHDAMVTMPEETAALLMEAAGR
jgi:pimeloyl-ACP methyl ester carboxylesterase